MINKIELNNFKLHNSSTINLKGLTILSGMNGMGKSSLIQSLLLLRQSFLTSDLGSGLNLKGDLCEVGTSGELECQSSEEHQLKINLLYSDKTDLNYCFNYPQSIYDTFLKGEPGNNADKEILKDYSLFNTHFQYLGSFRFGPQKSYGRDTSLVDTKKQISKEMGQCEYAIHYLDTYKKTPIPIRELAYTPEGSELLDAGYFLSSQVEAWLRRISPNIKIIIEPNSEDFKLKYKFDRKEELITESISAINTGYGITYVLPILIAILSAERGALIIIENPEAHIHPRGQAILMELMTLAVKHGVQIIIETHSDHIINGSLISIKNKTICNSDLSIYYFERDETKHVAVPHELVITETGRIKRPPQGFFDQIDIDLKILTGF